MKANKFAPRTAQSFDIPQKVRVSLYVAGADLDYDFEAAVFDNKLLKSIADRPLDKGVRAQLMKGKLNGLLGFELVRTPSSIGPLTTLLPFLNVGDEVEEIILQSQYMVEITAVEELTEALFALKIVHYAAAVLAREIGGIVLEPYSLKVYTDNDDALTQMQSVEKGTPSLKPFLTVVQSLGKGDKLRSTTHGLSRFGLPDFAVKGADPALAEPLSYFMRGLAQSFFEDVLKAKHEGLDRYSLAKPQMVSYDQLQKGNLEELPAPCQEPVPQEVPLKLNRSGDQAVLGLAFRGRSAVRNAYLQSLLVGLGLGSI